MWLLFTSVAREPSDSPLKLVFLVYVILQMEKLYFILILVRHNW